MLQQQQPRQPQAREEAKLHRRCVKLLRQRFPHVCTYRGDGGVQLTRGLMAYRLRRLEGGGQIGAADLLILLRGLNGGPLMVEFKSERGRLTPAQKDWIARVAEQGWKVVVVRSEAQFEAALTNHLGCADSEAVALAETPAPLSGVPAPMLYVMRRSLQSSRS